MDLLEIDALKVSHHGSRGNLCNELLDVVRTNRFLVSTNGAKFGHPDNEAIARILAKKTELGKQIYFNYPAATIIRNFEKVNDESPFWQSSTPWGRFDCEAKFAKDETTGIVLDLFKSR